VRSLRPAGSMRLLHFVKETRIRAAPEVVFSFHESPNALQSLMPPWEKMEVEESNGSLRPGSRVVLRGRAGLLPIRWVAIHTEYEPPHLFADRQESGPFAPPALSVAERSVRVQPGLYVCGDHRDNASIQGATVSERRAAEAVLEDQA
jgi:hypothetical protein